MKKEQKKYLKKIGNIIKNHRRNRGWRIDDVAKKIGCSKGWVSQCENGNGMFSCQILLKLLKILEIKINDIAAD